MPTDDEELSARQRAADPDFPDDLKGHFWTTIERLESPHRWTFAVVDYQNNVLLRGVTKTSAHATAIVTAWEATVTGLSDQDDPSLPSSGGADLVDGWAQVARD